MLRDGVKLLIVKGKLRINKYLYVDLGRLTDNVSRFCYITNKC